MNDQGTTGILASTPYEAWAKSAARSGKLEIKHAAGQIVLRTIDADGFSHNDLGPAEVTIGLGGRLSLVAFYRHGQIHRSGGPALMLVDPRGRIRAADWIENGRYVSDGLPSRVEFHNTGVPSRADYWSGFFHMGCLERHDGPVSATFHGGGEIRSVEYRARGADGLSEWQSFSFDRDGRYVESTLPDPRPETIRKALTQGRETVKMTWVRRAEALREMEIWRATSASMELRKQFEQACEREKGKRKPSDGRTDLGRDDSREESR
ncbi:hypothetical protein [Verrucomicrobium sp. 3C]|uniref:hypothetical protein n=1 Tax=Verrucomicrobium sp. 3C TaxID=1134055 RepID=UPI0003682790|nr:hypothetical protein [Verrucomicrobium sp. 3C]